MAHSESFAQERMEDAMRKKKVVEEPVEEVIETEDGFDEAPEPVDDTFLDDDED